MKKLLAFISAAAMMLSLSSCSSSAPSGYDNSSAQSSDSLSSVSSDTSTDVPAPKAPSDDFASGVQSINYKGITMDIPSNWTSETRDSILYYYFVGGFLTIGKTSYGQPGWIQSDVVVDSLIDGVVGSFDLVYGSAESSNISIGVNHTDAVLITVEGKLSNRDVSTSMAIFFDDSFDFVTVSLLEYSDSPQSHSSDYDRILSSIDFSSQSNSSSSTPSSSASSGHSSTDSQDDKTVEEDSEDEEEEEEDEEEPTTGEYNALRKARDYLNLMAFSRSGLIEQLEFEGYSHDEAVYAADNCGANWKKQAVKKAKEYLDMMAFSRSRLIEQLEYDGFTHKQAVYGAKKNGY